MNQSDLLHYLTAPVTCYYKFECCDPGDCLVYHLPPSPAPPDTRHQQEYAHYLLLDTLFGYRLLDREEERLS